ncbi:MAG: DUF4097 family beta strand repeat-containing protein [Lachnospiraceae bacterium]
MKNIMKGMIIFFSVLLVGLIGILTFALVTGSDRLPLIGSISEGFYEPKLINTETVSLEDISAIDIDNSSYDIIFKRGESEEIVIKEYGKSKDKTFVTAEKSGKTLNIKSNKNIGRTWFVIVSTYRYYEVYLPESYNGSMDVETSSGDIYAETNLTFSDFKVDSTSGYVELLKLSAANIDIQTSSGDVEADYLDGDSKISCTSGYVEVGDIAGNAKIETSSGDIDAGQVKGTVEISSQSGYVDVAESGGDTKIETNSGDVNIKNITGKLSITTSSGYVEADDIAGGGTIDTNSGDVNIEFTALTDDLDIQTSSGYVSCEIPQNTEFQFEANTSSGYIDTDFDKQLSFNKKGNQASGLIGDDADYKVTIKTSSGDIDVSYR